MGITSSAEQKGKFQMEEDIYGSSLRLCFRSSIFPAYISALFENINSNVILLTDDTFLFSVVRAMARSVDELNGIDRVTFK